MIRGAVKDNPWTQKNSVKVRWNPDKQARLVVGHPSVGVYLPENRGRKSRVRWLHLHYYTKEVRESGWACKL